MGRYLWLAFVVAFAVYSVAANLDEVRDFLQQQLDSFLKRPLTSQIIIGFIIWLISVIVPFIVYSYLVEQPEEGPGCGWLFFFLIVWPPAWPIAVILLLVMWIGSRF